MPAAEEEEEEAEAEAEAEEVALTEEGAAPDAAIVR